MDAATVYLLAAFLAIATVLFFVVVCVCIWNALCPSVRCCGIMLWWPPLDEEDVAANPPPHGTEA